MEPGPNREEEPTVIIQDRVAKVVQILREIRTPKTKSGTLEEEHRESHDAHN